MRGSKMIALIRRGRRGAQDSRDATVVRSTDSRRALLYAELRRRFPLRIAAPR
jgi:hypothetical protein